MGFGLSKRTEIKTSGSAADPAWLACHKSRVPRRPFSERCPALRHLERKRFKLRTKFNMLVQRLRPSQPQ